MKGIELVLGYRCDCRCSFCPGLQVGDPREMDLREIVSWLHFGRRHGALTATLGGGEPTLHRHFLKAVRAARELGYRTIEVATNGLRFAERDWAEACVKAGVNLASVGVLGARAEVHDQMTGRPGAFDLLRRGLANLASLEVALRADVLITMLSLPELPQTVETLTQMGATEVRFWLVSLHGLPMGDAARLLPRLEDVKGKLQESFDVARRLGVPASCLHNPPCTLDVPYRNLYSHAGLLDLTVVTPGGRPFKVELSPIEGGRYLEACERCAARAGCLGLRADYVAAFADTSVTPIPPA